MKKCKACEAEIPKKAKKCSSCWDDQRNWLVRHPIWTTVFILIWLSVYGSSLTESELEEAKLQQVIETQDWVNTAEEAKAKLSEIENESKEKIALMEMKNIRVEDEYSFAHLKLNIVNSTGEDIDGVKLRASFRNNFDEPLASSIGFDRYFQGIIQENIPAWSTYPATWQISLFQNATKVDEIEIYEIHTKSWKTYTID